MSWKPEFLVDGVWYDNAVRFATKEEAEGNARAKFMVWMVPTDCRAVESPDPVNYRWVEGRLETVEVRRTQEEIFGVLAGPEPARLHPSDGASDVEER